MRTKLISQLRIIEVPYDETSPMWKVSLRKNGGEKEAIIQSYITRPKGRRELDDYKDCGVYGVAGVPYEVSEIVSINKEKPHEEQVKSISELTTDAIKKGECVVMTGGGCSHTIGMIGGLEQALGNEKRIGFIWLDAHGDINTPESTQSGLVGGTPLATIIGLCRGNAYSSWMRSARLDFPLNHDQIILTDGRDLDPQEVEMVNATDINFINTNDFNNRSLWEKAVNILGSKVDVIYLHIDGDILDERYTPGQYTARSGGPSIETVMDNIKTVMKTDKVIAFSIVSLFHENDNPHKELCTLSGIRLLSAGLKNWKRCPEL